MSEQIRLRRGLDIPLNGEATPKITKRISPDSVAIKPLDYRALNPKLLVREGDMVKAGTPILMDKKRPEIKICSPISGVVSEIFRGEKRKLLEIRVKPDGENQSLEFASVDYKKADRQTLVDLLLESGLWANIKQRPYGTIPDSSVVPKAIFISSFDSSPLAPDMDFALSGQMNMVQIGVDVLSKLTSGGIHVGFHTSNYVSSPIHKLNNIISHTFAGKHPAGNVGVQIHHISPINKGEVVWTLDFFSVAAIGRLFAKKVYDVKKVIAITGPRCANPSYIEVIPGTHLSAIKEYIAVDEKDNLPARVISGNVLTGDNVGESGYLGNFHNQITILSEGKYFEMFGWIKPLRLKKFSISRSYFSWLMPSKKYDLDTNLNGGDRAFVVTGLYEKVLPMDIYPMHLLKAIMAGDIDKMEALGIYEIIEEDMALCEFVCPSKIEIQEIVSQGIDLMIKEMS